MGWSLKSDIAFARYLFSAMDCRGKQSFVYTIKDNCLVHKKWSIKIGYKWLRVRKHYLLLVCVNKYIKTICVRTQIYFFYLIYLYF